MKAKIILTLVIAIFAVACDKNKRASKRLIKPGSWEVVKLTVDGTDVSSESISWYISECDIYEELCTSSWILDEKQSQFYWQFNDKAARFTISRVVDTADCADFYTKEVEQMTYKFSGEYNVIESKRKSKIFESRETFGYKGETVRIELERN